MKMNKLTKYLAFILLSIGFCFVTTSTQIIKSPKIYMDFLSFYQGAKAASLNKNIYNYKNLDSLESPDVKECSRKYLSNALPYLYPPFLAYALIPLSKLNFTDAELLMKYSNIILFSLTLLFSFLIAQKFLSQTNIPNSKSLKRIMPVFLLSLIIIIPFRRNISLGQINIFVTFIITLSILLYYHKKDILSGSLLSIAILIKASPFILLLYFISIKRFKILYGVLLGGAIIVIYTLFLGAYNNWINYLNFLPSISYGKQIAGMFPIDMGYNFSFAIIFARIFGVNNFYTYLFSIITVASILIFLLYNSYKYRESKSIDLIMILYLILSVIGSPIAYNHHSILIISCVPLLFSFIYLNKFNKYKYWHLLIFILLIFLSGFDYNIIYFISSKIVLFKWTPLFNLFFSIALFVYIYLTIRKSIKIS